MGNTDHGKQLQSRVQVPRRLSQNRGQMEESGLGKVIL